MSQSETAASTGDGGASVSSPYVITPNDGGMRYRIVQGTSSGNVTFTISSGNGGLKLGYRCW